MSRVPFDLGYAHEMVACAAPAPMGTGTRNVAAPGLTARLRCLKALLDAERGARAPRRVH